MQILQQVYILILNPLYKLISGISVNVRNKLICFMCLLLAAYFPVHYSGIMTDWIGSDTNKHVLGSLMLGLLIIFSIDRPLKKVKWNKFFGAVYFLCALGILITGCLHPIGNGYRPFSMIMLVGFPCLYFVWNNRKDYRTLYDNVAKAVSIVGFAYFVLCILLSLKGIGFEEGIRYQATMVNTNFLGMIGVSTFTASIYLVVANRSNKWITMISSGAGLALVLFCESRTALLVIVADSLIWLVYYFRFIFDYNKSMKYMKTIVSMVAIIAIVVMAGYQLIECGTNIHMLKEASATAQETAPQPETTVAVATTVETEPTTVPTTTVEQPTTLPAETATTVPVTVPTTAPVPDNTMDRFSTEGVDINTFSSGRINIWKAYAANLNWIGHDMNAIDMRDVTGTTVRYAHNNVLEYAYRCGIPTGILYLLMEILAGIYILKCLFSKKKISVFNLFTMMAIMSFCIYSMLEIQVLPFKRDICFYFFMSLIPLFEKKIIYDEN